MDYKEIQLQNMDGILLLTINRPKALNALNKGVFDDLEAFFNTGYTDFEGLKGVIITGSGEKAFVAGADIKEFLSLDAEAAIHLSKRGQDVFFAIERFHLPVIALVNGFALGGGCELAMACHMRIAMENAKFGQPEVNLGLIPGYGGTQRLPQLVGKAKAMEMILTGDMINAEEAHRLGLVNYVCSSEDAATKATSIINKIATKGPNAVTKSISTINAYYDKNMNGYESEHKTFGTMMTSDETKEGVTAFIEKRNANFERG